MESNTIKLTSKGRLAVERVRKAHKALTDDGYTSSNATDKVAWVLCNDLPEGLVHFALGVPHGESHQQMRAQGYAE